MMVKRTEKLRKRGNMWTLIGNISVPNLKIDVDVVIGG